MTVTRVRGPQFQVPELLPVLASWIPQQRWFGGKDAAVEHVRLLRHTVLSLDSPEVHHIIVAVDQHTRSEAYQLLVSVHVMPVPALEHVRIAALDGRYSYDGLHDPTAAALLLQHMANGDRVETLTFVPEPVARIPVL